MSVTPWDAAAASLSSAFIHLPACLFQFLLLLLLLFNENHQSLAPLLNPTDGDGDGDDK